MPVLFGSGFNVIGVVSAEGPISTRRPSSRVGVFSMVYVPMRPTYKVTPSLASI